MRTKQAAEGTYKAFVKLGEFFDRIGRRYTTEVITFQRVSPIKKWEGVYDLDKHIYDPGFSTNFWAFFGFWASMFGFYGLATLWHDKNLQYYFYTTYPKQMRMFDAAKDEILLQHKVFLSKMPFQGDMPDITKPENFNKFRREMKNYFWNTEEKQKLKQESVFQLKTEGKDYDQTVLDFTQYIEDESKKLSKAKFD